MQPNCTVCPYFGLEKTDVLIFFLQMLMNVAWSPDAVISNASILRVATCAVVDKDTLYVAMDHVKVCVRMYMHVFVCGLHNYLHRIYVHIS